MKMIKELTKDFRKQDWRLISKYVDNPTKFKSQSGKFDPIIIAAKEFYKDLDIREAMFLFRNDLANRPKCPACNSDLPYNFDTYTYPKYCSRQCRNVLSPTGTANKILINGTEYPSIDAAMADRNEFRDTIRYNILNPNVPEYRYSDNHENRCKELIENIHPDFLKKETITRFIEDRVPMIDVMEKYGIKNHSTLKLAYAYHGVDTKYRQISDSTRESLLDEEQFAIDFAAESSDELAEKYGCSPSTILQTAAKYGISTVVRRQSAIERHLVAWLREVTDLEIIPLDRKTIGLELDIYIPEKKLAIELDGLRFHSTTQPKSPDVVMRHRKKTDLCAAAGILLLRFVDVGETGDKNKLNIIKSMILNRLGFSKKIYARKCTIGNPTSQEARRFFDSNHISGSRGAKIHVGLYHGSELVMVMSFSESRRDKSRDWEIIRMAASLGTTVVGGGSKLIKWFRDNYPGSIMTYSNLRFGNGASYEKMGFKYARTTDPGYFYTNMKENFSREKFQKQNINKVCREYDPNKTEHENAIANGYTVYWDCGNRVFYLD